MNRLLTILLLLGATAHGQINNPPTSVNIVDSTATGRAVLTATNSAAAATAIGLGAANSVTFSNVTATGSIFIGTSAPYLRSDSGSGSVGFYDSVDDEYVLSIPSDTDDVIINAQWNNAGVRNNLGLGATNNVEFRRLKMIAANATDSGDDATLWLDTSGTNKFASMRISGTGGSAEKYNAFLTAGNAGLQATSVNGFRVLNGSVVNTGSVLFAVNSSGNATLNGVNNTAPSQTADSGSSLMTRDLGDDHYLGEFWHAWRMSSYNTTNIPVGVFKTAPCVLYTNGQSPFYVEAFLDPSKYAGKTVRVLAYCRVDSTNGGNVQGAGQIKYLTNTAGGPDSNFPLTIGGQAHGTIGVFTNQNTDVFPVATSTNQYLIFTSNVGTISNNATMIIASFGFNRASTNTTFTNGNLYMQGVQVVVENP
jgi:hypothetical protein